MFQTEGRNFSLRNCLNCFVVKYNQRIPIEEQYGIIYDNLDQIYVNCRDRGGGGGAWEREAG